MTPAIGSQLGPYVLERLLGQGGMGDVYLGRHVETGARHAVKVLSLIDPEAAQRFRREGEAMARLDGHPNVVQVHSCSADRDHLYLALELVDGPNLEERLRQGPLPPDEAARLIEAVARGLAEAHAAGVLHRDLKPANVLIAADGTPKLADFGLARLTDAASLTETGTVMGSPNYMAPEQAEGRTPSPATDVYGLGATLYAALTGRPPFEGSALLALLAQVAQDDPVPVRRLAPSVPAALEAICHRCLAKDPQARYPSVAAVAEALASQSAVTQVARRRPRLLLPALGVALVGGLALAARQAGSPPGRAQPSDDASNATSPPTPAPAPDLTGGARRRLDAFATAWRTDPRQAALDLRGLRDRKIDPARLHPLLDEALTELIRTSPEETEAILSLGSQRCELLEAPPHILPAFRSWVAQRVRQSQGAKSPPIEVLLAGLRSDALLFNSNDARRLLSALNPKAIQRFQTPGSRAGALLGAPRLMRSSQQRDRRALIKLLEKATRSLLPDLGPKNQRLAVYVLAATRLITRKPTRAEAQIRLALRELTGLRPLERELASLGSEPPERVEPAIEELVHLLEQDARAGRALSAAVQGYLPTLAKVQERAIEHLQKNVHCVEALHTTVEKRWPKKPPRANLANQRAASHAALGSELRRAGRPEQALVALELAVSLVEQQPERAQIGARSQLAHLHFEQGHFKAAEQAIKPILEQILAKGEPRASALAVLIARALKQSEEAQRRLEVARTAVQREHPAKLAAFNRLVSRKSR